jgi:hypothetical protein
MAESILMLNYDESQAAASASRRGFEVKLEMRPQYQLGIKN